MADIVDMSGKQSKRAAQPNAHVIEFAKELLRCAQDGSIQQVAAVWVAANGTVGDGYSPGGHPDELYPVIGGLEVCKATLLSQMMGGTDG